MENPIIKSFNCDLCNKNFKTEKHLLKHKYTKHYKCKHCSNFFKTNEDFVYHLFMNDIYFDYDGKIIYNINEFIRKLVSMNSHVQCKQCYKYFYNESDCSHHRCSEIHWWMINNYENTFEFKYYNLLFLLHQCKECCLCYDHQEITSYILSKESNNIEINVKNAYLKALLSIKNSLKCPLCKLEFEDSRSIFSHHYNKKCKSYEDNCYEDFPQITLETIFSSVTMGYYKYYHEDIVCELRLTYEEFINDC